MEKDYPVVLIKCRRGQDAATSGQECGSNQAYNLANHGDFVVKFKCVKCGYIWSTPVGGSMNLPPGV